MNIFLSEMSILQCYSDSIRQNIIDELITKYAFKLFSYENIRRDVYKKISKYTLNPEGIMSVIDDTFEGFFNFSVNSGCTGGIGGLKTIFETMDSSMFHREEYIEHDDYIHRSMHGKVLRIVDIYDYNEEFNIMRWSHKYYFDDTFDSKIVDQDYTSIILSRVYKTFSNTDTKKLFRETCKKLFPDDNGRSILIPLQRSKKTLQPYIKLQIPGFRCKILIVVHKNIEETARKINIIFEKW